MEFTDQIGNDIVLTDFPNRIVSLVPSQTELLYFWGMKRQIVGQTLFCIKPEKEFKESVKVGGTKKLNIDKIRELKPDLIIGNKEENDKEQIETLQKEFPVWMSDINSIDDALDMIIRLGVVLGKMEKAVKLDHKIRVSLEKINPLNKSAIYLIWQKPYMAAGENTFIDDVMQLGGIQNLAYDASSRYPELSLEKIKELNPDLLLLSSEPFPFKEEHKIELKSQLPNTEVKLVDGEIFSWYGSKMLEVSKYLTQL